MYDNKVTSAEYNSVKYDHVTECALCKRTLNFSYFSNVEKKQESQDDGRTVSSQLGEVSHITRPKLYRIPKNYLICLRCQRKLLELDNDDNELKATATLYFDKLIHEYYSDFAVWDLPEPYRSIALVLESVSKELPHEVSDLVKTSESILSNNEEDTDWLYHIINNYDQDYKPIYQSERESDKRESVINRNDALGMFRLALDNKKNTPRLTLNHAVVGEIPSFIDELTELKELIITNSNIDSFPEKMSGLINLRFLDVSGSTINQLPESIGDLKSLDYLNVGKTLITSLPIEIGQLDRLETLDGSDALIKILPETVGSLSSLKTMSLKNNQIEYLPNNIGKLNSLEVVDLSNNKLAELPASVGDLKNLEVLNLSGNLKLSYLPKSIGNLCSLKSLVLCNTLITKLPETICNLSNLHILDLRGCSDLSELPENIGKLHQLRTLRLDDTSIKKLPGSLAKMKNLRFLSLSGTPITRLPSDISCLHNLEYLNASYSKLSALPVKLAGLGNLQILDLRHSALLRLPDDINKLSSLKHLLLGATRMEEVNTNIGELIGLNILDLSSTNIKTIPNELCDLSNLYALYLEDIEIEKLPERIGGLKKLSVLSLARSKRIKTLPDTFQELGNLRELNLSESGIEHIPGYIFRLKKLCRINLVNVSIDELPEEISRFKYDINCVESIMPHKAKGVFIKGIMLRKQPVSIFYQKKELIQKYFLFPRIPVNETKVIFLGDGFVGKSHSIQRLENNCEEGEYTTEETMGIDISIQEVNKRNVSYKIHFWDFGGQKLYESMHRCFLTNRTCYVVVVSTRLNNEFSRAQYWIRSIATFAPGSPILIYVNLWGDEKDRKFDVDSLRLVFPNANIVGSIAVSAAKSKKEEFRLLKNAIEDMVEATDSNSLSLPQPWNNLRQEIIGEKAKGNYYISYNDYIRKCQSYGIDSLGIQLWLLEWFNDLGECFSFANNKSDIGSLWDLKVINPEWLNNAVYRIIKESDPFNDSGLITHSGINTLLEVPKEGLSLKVSYSREECDYVLEVMRKFGLSYNIKEANLEFVPALIKNNRPREMFVPTYNAKLLYVLKYEQFLPENIIQKLMVSHYRDLLPEKCWKEGFSIQLNRENIYVNVYRGIIEDELRIDVYSKGSVEPWACLQWLLKEIRDINNQLNLSPNEFVFDNDRIAGIKQLLNGYIYRMAFVPAQDGRGMHSVEDILQSVYGERNLARAIQIFDNYGDAPTYYSEGDKTTVFKSILENNINFFDFRGEDKESLINDKRLNCDIKISEEVLNRLIKIGEYVCRSSLYNKHTHEDVINDAFRDMLIYDEIFEVRDQTRRSLAKKEAGKVDILLLRNGKEVALFEAMKLDSVNQAIIDEHIDKTIHNYNTLGTATFIVAYVYAKDFKAFWTKYYDYIRYRRYEMSIKRGFHQLEYPNALMRVATVILSKNGYDFPVYFVALNLDTY